VEAARRARRARTTVRLVGRAGRLLIALAAAVVVATLVGPAGAADDPAAVLLDDAGPGFQRVGDAAGAPGTLTRSFRHPHGQLQLSIVPISPDIDVRTMFSVFADTDFGLQRVDVKGLALARWFITPGSRPDNADRALVVFASRHAIFTGVLVTDGSGELRAVKTLLAISERQVERAGGPPAAPLRPAGGQEAAELTKLLPTQPAPRFGPTQSATISGTDELPPGVGIDPKVIAFLNDRAHTAVRVWSTDSGVAAAVGITKYPYGIFAAAALHAAGELPNLRVVTLPGLGDIAHVITFVGTGPKAGQVGASFRRGPYSVTVLGQTKDSAGAAAAAGLVIDLTRQTAGRLPAGASSPYHFPSPPSTLAALALTGLFVTTAGASSIGVGRARAWSLRRAKHPPAYAAPVVAPSSAVVALDEDARQLRRRGVTVVVVQLVAVNVMVIALAGDFGWPGVAIAVLGLASGLAFTSWWRQRELGAIGPDAPRRRLVLPRFGGLVMGVLALAILALGVSYSLKGLRYLVLKPTLAQLKWSNRLGLTPRGVGLAFAIGGVAVAALGGILFRLARALGRANTRKLLDVDRRPPILYLRSFGDDKLPLATIASARRPFFELFSFRGRDPFEEAVAWELTTYGPVVAVGRPGHSLASLGAAREHLSDATWKTQVAARMTDARAVTVATGETPGLHWEIEQLVTAGHLHKTLFLFPPVSPDLLDRRWAFTSAALAAAGACVAALPFDVGFVHTAQVMPDRTVMVTVARRRDEATYRTAVDRAMAAMAALPAVSPPWPAPSARAPATPPMPAAPAPPGAPAEATAPAEPFGPPLSR
jgi:hypothetical protein